MPMRDWLGNLTLALVAAGALICAVGIVGAIMSEQYIKRHQTNAEYQRNAESDRRATSHEIAETCQNRSGDAFRLCIAERVEAYYRDQATNEDLQAQQDMAYWAAALFFSSTLLTGVGIYLLYGTLAATRETLAEAGWTTKAAEAQVAQAALASKLELRASLAIEPDGIDQLIGRQEVIGKVVLKNIGKLPARNVNLVVRMERSTNPEPQDSNRRTTFSLPRPGVASDRVLQPGAGMRQGSKKYLKLADLLEPHYGIYVFGIATYDNGYGEECFTRFCHRYSTSAHNRKIDGKIVDWKTVAMESRTFIGADKARYHTHGNTAEELQPSK